MPHIIMLCRCPIRRTIMVVGRAGEYRFPSIEMARSEARRTAFDRFVREEFGMDSDMFEPDFRAVGYSIGRGAFQHFVLCSVCDQVMPIFGYGQCSPAQWIGRLDLQNPEKFSEDTRRLLGDETIRNLLLRFRRSDLLDPE
jgi:hypothetical protein